MEYLRKEDIILINKKTIERHGGTFNPPSNFLNEAALDYLIEAVDSELFDEPLYPEIHHKAGLYFFNISSNHIFQDGNKRTALASCHIFLKLNEFHFRMNLKTITIEDKIIPSKGESSNEILIAFSLELADGKISLEECQFWIAANIIDSSEVIY